MEHTHCLAVKGLGAVFGPKVVLAEVDFEVPTASVTVLLGPSGSGKSTVLRALAGLNTANARYQEWGTALYQGQPVAQGHRPRLVQQNTRLMATTTLDALADQVRGQLALSPLELRGWFADYVTRMGFPELQASFDRLTVELPAVQLRAVSILREAVCEPALLMVDEPTSNLSDYDAYQLLDLLRAVGRSSALLLVLHNQKHARMVGQHMVLLAGGRVQEAGTMEAFLSMPQSAAGQQFVRTGSCAVPSPDATADTLAEGIEAPPPLPAAARQALVAHGAAVAKASDRLQPQAPQQVPTPAAGPTAEPPSAPASAPAPVLETTAATASAARVKPAAHSSAGPSGFAWLVPGQLAGTPLPGVVHDIDLDLAALRRMGITLLITLTERDLPQEPLLRHGLRNLHLPIYDREPPTVAQIQMLLKRMEILLAQGHVLAVHCLAGIGRTGTVLAAWLVREGLAAPEALRRVRLIDAQYVQTTEQEDFLQLYEDAILRRII